MGLSPLDVVANCITESASPPIEDATPDDNDVAVAPGAFSIESAQEYASGGILTILPVTEPAPATSRNCCSKRFIDAEGVSRVPPLLPTDPGGQDFPVDCKDLVLDKYAGHAGAGSDCHPGVRRLAPRLGCGSNLRECSDYKK